MLTSLASSAGGSGISPLAVLYGLAALATVTACLLALRSGFRAFIRQRQSEAVEKNDLSKVINGNADATRANTEALGKLGQDFAAFAAETRATIHGLDDRIIRLEKRRPPAPRRQGHPGGDAA